MAQTPRAPDVKAQQIAMKKLGFLAGEWAGEASVLRGPGQFAELTQTESAQFKLDGLVLEIEGVGRICGDTIRIDLSFSVRPKSMGLVFAAICKLSPDMSLTES